MSEADQITGLESALADRANRLAEEYVANGRQEHDRLLAEARQRLRLEEEHQIAAAQALGDRTYQQQVQAAELQLRADLDRLRMELVTAVLARLSARLEELAGNDARYLPLLRTWTEEGAREIEHNELVVELNARDLRRMKANWEQFAREAAPGKRLTLAPEPIPCVGGVRVTSADGNIRVDNTFEGRQERLGEVLQNAIAARLAPAPATGGQR